MNTLENANIIELFAALTYENWFTQLAVLSDAYREAGDDAKADRCGELRLFGKRPKMVLDGDTTGYCFWFEIHIDHEREEHRLPRQTTRYIDRRNGILLTNKLRDQLNAYLQIPEHLRIKEM